jgi:hypothetical protein
MKIFLILLASITFGFGFWYLMFVFITKQPNLIEWHWLTKIVYLFFSFASTEGIIGTIKKD